MEKRFSLVIFGIEQTRLRGFCGTAGAVCLGLFPADSVAVESGLALWRGPGLAGGPAATKTPGRTFWAFRSGGVFNIPRSHNNGSLIGKQYALRLKELKEAGAEISLVQIYSATRPMARTGCSHLPLKSLSQIAKMVRRVAGLRAEIF